MTLPANIRINTSAPFPALVQGGGPIVISKANGIWTVGYSLVPIAVGSPAPGSPTDYVLVYDSITGTYSKVSLANLTTSAGAQAQRIVTAAGDVTVAANDQIILVNKTVGAATNIILPTAISRAGVSVMVKDLKGDANTNNLTFVPNGVETIDGYSPATAITNGTALIDTINGRKTLVPLASGGGWFSLG